MTRSQQAQFAAVRDETLAYEFEYPLATASGRELPMVRGLLMPLGSSSPSACRAVAALSRLQIGAHGCRVASRWMPWGLAPASLSRFPHLT